MAFAPACPIWKIQKSKKPPKVSGVQTNKHSEQARTQRGTEHLVSHLDATSGVKNKWKRKQSRALTSKLAATQDCGHRQAQLRQSLPG